MQTQQLLTIEDMCARYRISRSSFYIWRKAGLIPPGQRIGKKNYWTARHLRLIEGDDAHEKK